MRLWNCPQDNERRFNKYHLAQALMRHPIARHCIEITAYSPAPAGGNFRDRKRLPLQNPSKLTFLIRHSVCFLNSDDGRLFATPQMVENLESLPARVDSIERKLDALSLSVDERFEQIDRRFEEVNEHFAEQRQYTEFAYERLDERMTAGLGRLERAMTAGFDRLEAAITAGNAHFERIERTLDQATRGRPAATRRRRSPGQPKKR